MWEGHRTAFEVHSPLQLHDPKGTNNHHGTGAVASLSLRAACDLLFLHVFVAFGAFQSCVPKSLTNVALPSTRVHLLPILSQRDGALSVALALGWHLA